jgi:hypothetical protein
LGLDILPFLEGVTLNKAVAIKSAKQNYCPSDEILNLLEQFRLIVYDCIAIGLRENVYTHSLPMMVM